ncbi:MAG: SEL1-like repeat protein, partial [Maritimibacter sp.]|nr:SEL1-like repeat protein [Maritimibacter sp.]
TEAAPVDPGTTGDGALEAAALGVDRTLSAGPTPSATVEANSGVPQAAFAEQTNSDAVIAQSESAPAAPVPDPLGLGEEMSETSGTGVIKLAMAAVAETAEPLSGADLARVVTPELAESAPVGDSTPAAKKRVFIEEMRDSEPLVLASAPAGNDATLEAAPPARLVPSDLAHATLTEEIESHDAQVRLAALAADPTAPFEEKSMTDPNEIACLEMLGTPNAGVPVSQAAADAQRSALAGAVGVCEAAASSPNPGPEVLYFAGDIALAKRETAQAFSLFQQAAEDGLPAAVTKLGDFYLFGAAPEGRDLEKAVAQFEQGTALGDPAAMTSLAMMHRASIGVTQDTARMVSLLTDAAELGYHFAEFRLAQTLYNGDGIPGRADPALGIPDPQRAAGWYTKAADAGNIEAALELAGLYGDPASGLPENPAEQARLTKVAADSGLSSALAAMGVLYEYGRGVVASPETAADYYIRALETGEVPFEELRKGAPFDWDQPTAVAFQTALSERGVYTGIIDGLVGPGTRAAAETLAAGG